MTRIHTIQRNITIGLVLCTMAIAALVTAGGITFTVQPNATTSDQINIKRTGEFYEGFGASSLDTENYASGTSTVTGTRTGNNTQVWGAMRINENASQLSSSSMNAGVMYFYWNIASSCIDLAFKNATGTAYIMHTTATSIP